MKRFKIFFLVLLLIPMFGFVSILNAAPGTTYYSVATGNWTSPSSWSLTSGGSPISSGYPSANDVVVIELGKTITINGGENILASSITIGGASTSGILYFRSAGTATLNISGDLTIGGGISSANGTLDYNSWGLEITCARLLKGTGGATRINAISQDFTFTGSFTLDASFNEFRNFRVNGGVVTLSGNIDTNGSNSPWIYAGSTLDLGAYTMTLYQGYGNFKIDGTLIVGGANNFPSDYKSIEIGPSSTIKYNFNGNQNIWPLDYANLIIAGGGYKCTSGIISSLSLINGGTGYENDRDAILNFSGGDGIGAAGTINIDDNEGDYTNIDGEWVLTDPNPNYGKISSVALTNFGSGYTSAPSVSIGGRSEWSYIMGSGAVITANFRNTYTASNIIKQDGALFCGEVASSLSLFSPLATLTSCLGSSSTPTTFGVSGSGLTASVTITAPTNFEISTALGGTYSSSLTLTNTTNVSETIYVRLNSSATVGSITGTITATSSSITATTTVSGTVNTIPLISIGKADLSGITINDGIICNGASATLTASGGSTYLWSTGESTASITKSPTNTTTYTVTGTTSAGCSNITSVTVTVNPIPTISISESDASGSSNNDSKVCIGGIATLTAIGGSTYSWSTSDLTASIIPSISSITTYTVTGTSAAGCSNITSVIISVEALPSLSFGSISLCADATYLITKTTSMPVDNGWSVSGTISVNNGYVTAGTTQGTYTVSYTDGCAQTVSASVTVGNSDISPAITGLASYKISNTNPIPQGPTASLYMGYNGFNYSSTTKPTKPGFYRANNVSGNSAGCPFPFEIFRCTTCPD
jgi:hypothetical protein